MYGIRFEVPNKYGNVLSEIFEDIAIDEFNWLIAHEDILVEPVKTNEDLFTEKIICGSQLKVLLNRAPYYILSAKLYAFPNKSECIQVNSFREFNSSSCELMAFFTDAIYVDIYLKKEEIIKILVLNTKKHNFKNIEIITRIGPRDTDLLPK